MLEILERLGRSVSGAPIHRVRCGACGDTYLLTAERSQIEQTPCCSGCSHKRREVPDRLVGRARRRRLRDALRVRGFRLVLPTESGQRPVKKTKVCITCERAFDDYTHSRVKTCSPECLAIVSSENARKRWGDPPSAQAVQRIKQLHAGGLSERKIAPLVALSRAMVNRALKGFFDAPAFARSAMPSSPGARKSSATSSESSSNRLPLREEKPTP